MFDFNANEEDEEYGNYLIDQLDNNGFTEANMFGKRTPIEYWKNPSTRKLNSLSRKHGLRGMTAGDNVLVWDGANLDHRDFKASLGLDPKHEENHNFYVTHPKGQGNSFLVGFHNEDHPWFSSLNIVGGHKRELLDVNDQIPTHHVVGYDDPVEVSHYNDIWGDFSRDLLKEPTMFDFQLEPNVVLFDFDADEDKEQGVAHSLKALFATKKVSSDPRLLKLAHSAYDHAVAGAHKAASLDHSILWRGHRERNHTEAQELHEKAMDHHEKANHANSGKKAWETPRVIKNRNASFDFPREDNEQEGPGYVHPGDGKHYVIVNPETGEQFTGRVSDPEHQTLHNFIAGHKVSGEAYDEHLLNGGTPSDPEGWHLDSEDSVRPTTADELGWLNPGQLNNKGESEDEQEEDLPSDSDSTGAPQFDVDSAHAIVHGDDEQEEEEQTKPAALHTLDNEGVSKKPIEDKEAIEKSSKQKESLNVMRTATKEISKNLSPVGKDILKQNVSNVAYFHSSEELMKALKEEIPELNEEPDANRIKLMGSFLRNKKKLFIDGGDDKQVTKDVQAAIIGRAIANGADETPEWHEIYEKEIKGGKLTWHANKNEKTAWAEFVGRLIHGNGVAAEEASKKYPSATAYVQGLGLIPDSNKNPLVQLPEGLHSSIDGDEIEGDSAYSPKKAGLMTFARIGMHSIKEGASEFQDKIKEALVRVPAPVKMAVAGLMSYVVHPYLIAKKKVKEFEMRRGELKPEEVERISSILAYTDAMTGGKLIPLALAVATGKELLAIASPFIPVGALAYLAMSKAGLIGWKKADASVRRVIKSKEQKEPSFSAIDFASMGKVMPEEMIELIHHHLSQFPGNPEDWLTCYFAALDRTYGNVELACEIADMSASMMGSHQLNYEFEEEPEFEEEVEAPSLFDFEEEIEEASLFDFGASDNDVKMLLKAHKAGDESAIHVLLDALLEQGKIAPEIAQAFNANPKDHHLNDIIQRTAQGKSIGIPKHQLNLMRAIRDGKHDSRQLKAAYIGYKLAEGERVYTPVGYTRALGTLGSQHNIYPEGTWIPKASLRSYHVLHKDTDANLGVKEAIAIEDPTRTEFYRDRHEEGYQAPRRRHGTYLTPNNLHAFKDLNEGEAPESVDHAVETLKNRGYKTVPVVRVHQHTPHGPVKGYIKRSGERGKYRYHMTPLGKYMLEDHEANEGKGGDDDV